MTRRTVGLVSLLGVVIVAGVVTACHRPPPPPRSEAEIRQALFDAVQPVKVTNCELARFGEPHDGGYLMCGNLLSEVRAGYSYGIDGYDGWGCQLSSTLKVPVHQYDCFNTTQPSCEGDTTFHAECVGPSVETVDGRLFGTLQGQVERNGHVADRLVVKMDIEGAEWDSLLHTPDAALANIDQLAVEFHRIDQEKFVQVIERLKHTFYVAHLHFNNHVCEPGLDPFPAWAFEVLLVNKRVGIVDDPPAPAAGPHPLDTPSAPSVPDCQVVAR